MFYILFALWRILWYNLFIKIYTKMLAKLLAWEETMNRKNRNIFVSVMLVLCMMALTGCNGAYVNRHSSEQMFVGPDGKVARMIVTNTQDNSGDVAAHMTGMAGQILGNGANAAFATNFGKGYPNNKQLLHNMTYGGNYIGGPVFNNYNRFGGYGGYGGSYLNSAPIGYR